MMLAAVLLMDLLAGMEFDLFVPSFPELQHQFQLTPFWVEALLSVNFIGYCLSLFFVGTLADNYGGKPIIALGLACFIIGCISCIWATTYAYLIIGRFLQGVGIAAPSILSFLIIADTYPLKKQQYLMAMLNGVINFSIGAAPVLGSYITLYFQWEGNFITLFGMGVITLVMTFVFIPQHKQIKQPEPFSLIGYLHIFNSKSLLLLISHLVFVFVPYWIFVGMSPLLFMESFGVPLSIFGFYQGALASIFAVGSILFGLMVGQYEDRKILVITNYIFIFSLATLAFVSFSDCANPLLITLAFVPFILGQIIPSTILYPISLNLIPQAKGKVSASIQGFKLILSAISVQIAGYFYVGTFQNIGYIMTLFIIASIISLIYVMKNSELMVYLKKP